MKVILNDQLYKFVEKHRGSTVHLINGRTVRFSREAAETALLLLTFRRMNDQDGYNPVFPSLATLAARAGISVRAMQMRLSQLETLGLVRRIPAWRPDGRSTSNRYEFAIPSVVDKPSVIRRSRKSSSPNRRATTPKPEMQDCTPLPAQPFTLKAYVSNSVTPRSTYLDQPNHNQNAQPAELSTTDAVVVQFCYQLGARDEDRRLMKRALDQFGLEATRKAIQITMNQFERVHVSPFRYAYGVALNQYQLEQVRIAAEKERARRKTETELIYLRSVILSRFEINREIFGPRRAMAIAVVEIARAEATGKVAAGTYRPLVEQISRELLTGIDSELQIA